MWQVEYLFSDLSLMANDTMAKNVSKDPEGYGKNHLIGVLGILKTRLALFCLLIEG